MRDHFVFGNSNPHIISFFKKNESPLSKTFTNYKLPRKFFLQVIQGLAGVWEKKYAISIQCTIGYFLRVVGFIYKKLHKKIISNQLVISVSEKTYLKKKEKYHKWFQRMQICSANVIAFVKFVCK